MAQAISRTRRLEPPPPLALIFAIAEGRLQTNRPPPINRAAGSNFSLRLSGNFQSAIACRPGERGPPSF